MSEDAQDFDPSTHPHRRVNPLTGEHVLVSPHRMKRPWQGQVEPPQPAELPQYDPECYLCPGNERAGGQRNDVYEETMTFTNDFAAVLPPPMPRNPKPSHPLLTAQPVQGACDVLIFHPRHDLTLARLPIDAMQSVIRQWCRIYASRGSQEGIEYVQIFENKGAMMGCSNPHPHGQVWSLSVVPSLPATELKNLNNYALSTTPSDQVPRGPRDRACLLCDYVHHEVGLEEHQSRVITKNAHWVALVPWWAVWPFEVLVLPYKRHVPSLLHLQDGERLAFAEILSSVTKRYDNLFQCPFAYSMGIHQRPIPPVKDVDPDVSIQGDVDDEGDLAHLHAHFAPPLLRSASVRKFLVGFELMAEPQRDLTPEQGAIRLRACSEIHYLDGEEPQQGSSKRTNPCGLM